MTEGWEHRMSTRHRERVSREHRERMRARLGEFVRYLHADDPDEILLEIIAARCLGLSYGDPGPHLPPDLCRWCWGDRKIWLGNTWGMRHTSFGGGFEICQHSCHANEIWLANEETG
jgi:hypothetical protein